MNSHTSIYKTSLLLTLEILLLPAVLVLASLGFLPLPIIPLILIAWVSLRQRHLRWRDIGVSRPAHWIKTISLAILIGVGYQVLDSLLIAPLLQKLTGEAIDLSQFEIIRGNLPLLITFLLISWTLAGFAEELFFRGYLLNRILDFSGRERMGMIFALIGNAIIFGAAHFNQGLPGVFDTAIAGVVLGVLYFASGRNLWLPIFTHGVIDTVGFLLIYAGQYS